MALQLPTLKKHKKKLLGPISSLESIIKVPLHKVSWSDFGFYQYLWLGFLLHNAKFEESISFCIKLGHVIKVRGANLKDAGAHWSYISAERHKLFYKTENNNENRTLIAAWDAIDVQTKINGKKFQELEQNQIAQDLSFIRNLCDKEDPFALKVMYLGFITLVHSDRLKIPGEIFSKLDPLSLDSYPDNDSACSSAGMLRSFFNAHSSCINNERQSITPFPLWQFMCKRSRCE